MLFRRESHTPVGPVFRANGPATGEFWALAGSTRLTDAEGVRMSKVIADMSMSLDGYVTAPGVDQEHGLGIGGEAIHAWVLEEPRSSVDEAVLARSFEQTGAVVMGQRLYHIVDGPNGWKDDVGYGQDQNQSAAPPCYVVTHEPPAHVRLASRFRFVTDGVAAAAIDQARATAGDKDVVVILRYVLVDPVPALPGSLATNAQSGRDLEPRSPSSRAFLIVDCSLRSSFSRIC